MMKNITFVLLYILCCFQGFSQVVIDDKFESTTLENKMSIFRDSTNSMTAQEVVKQKPALPFIISKDPVPNFVYDHTRRWVHFKVINKAQKRTTFFIRIHHSYIDTVDFYLVKNNRILDEKKFRWEVPFFNRSNQFSRLPVAQFEVTASDTVEVYFMARRVVSTWNLAIEVFSTEHFFQRERTENTIYGLLAGGMILTVLMALFLFALHREWIYLHYMIYIVSTTLSILGIAGFTNFYFGNTYRLLTGPESYSFFLINTVIFNIFFTQNLFNINRNNTKWLYYIGRIIMLFCISLNLLFIYDFHNVYVPSINPLIDLTSLLYVFVVVLTIGFSLYQKKFLALFYLIAFFPLLILILINILSDLGLIPRSPYLIFMAPVCVLFEIIVLFLGLAFRMFEFQKNKLLLEAKIITSQIETQEAERKHIAQDLHDDLGATLSALKGRNKQEEFSEETQNLLNKAITDLRAISRRLLPADFEMFGFIPSVEKYIADINKQQKLKVSFIIFGEIVKLNTEKELNIYRIISELVNNSTKYSNGQNATVQLIYHQDYLFVSVEDDGQVENKNENNLGIGLKNVISRLEYLSATIIEKGGANGYSFIFEIPYKPNL